MPYLVDNSSVLQLQLWVPSQAAVMARLKHPQGTEAPHDMDTTTLDFNTLTLLLAILGSTLTTVILIFRQSNHFDKKMDRLDAKFDTKIDALDTKFDTKIDALDAKFDTKIDALDAKFDTKIDALDTKFDTKIDALDTKFDTKIDALDTKITGEFRALHGEFKIVRREISVIGERLARVEGHLMGPESFRMPGPRPPAADEAPAEDPGPDRRQAG